MRFVVFNRNPPNTEITNDAFAEAIGKEIAFTLPNGEETKAVLISAIPDKENTGFEFEIEIDDKYSDLF